MTGGVPAREAFLQARRAYIRELVLDIAWTIQACVEAERERAAPIAQAGVLPVMRPRLGEAIRDDA